MARGPRVNSLAVFYLHFWWGSWNFVSFRVVNSTGVFWLLLKMTYHITQIFNKNVLFPVDVAAFQPFFLPDSGGESMAYWLWSLLEAGATKQKLALNANLWVMSMKTEWLEGKQCPESIWPFLPSVPGHVFLNMCLSVPVYDEFTRHTYRLPALPKMCPPGFSYSRVWVP